MKNIFFSSALLLCFAGLLSLTSCSNGDPAIDNSQTGVQNTVQSGTWHITSFVDSGKDETNHFSGYSFTFGNNDVLTSTNGSSTFTGVWNISDSNSNDDSINDLHFNIQFNLTNDFESLNEDWSIISRTNTRIELIHISGGNGGTDYLTFEKS
jgi:hypothetical protein